MEFTGKIERIGSTEEVGSNGFKKRNVVLKQDGEYPQFIQFEFQKDKTNILDNYNVGDEVTVRFNLRGRDWTNSDGDVINFTTLVGFGIKKTETDDF